MARWLRLTCSVLEPSLFTSLPGFLILSGKDVASAAPKASRAKKERKKEQVTVPPKESAGVLRLTRQYLELCI